MQQSRSYPVQVDGAASVLRQRSESPKGIDMAKQATVTRSRRIGPLSRRVGRREQLRVADLMPRDQKAAGQPVRQCRGHGGMKPATDDSVLMMSDHDEVGSRVRGYSDDAVGRLARFQAGQR